MDYVQVPTYLFSAFPMVNQVATCRSERSGSAGGIKGSAAEISPREPGGGGLIRQGFVPCRAGDEEDGETVQLRATSIVRACEPPDRKAQLPLETAGRPLVTRGRAGAAVVHDFAAAAVRSASNTH
ncbi:unnamed protein product, partial [Nesidiocoris tenuis]